MDASQVAKLITLLATIEPYYIKADDNIGGRCDDKKEKMAGGKLGNLQCRCYRTNSDNTGKFFTS